MAFKSWVTPTGVIRGSGRGGYTMGGGGGRAMNLAAIGATPSDIARPVIPAPTAPALDRALDTSITAAMAPGRKTLSTPGRGGSRTPDLQANPTFAEPSMDPVMFDEDMMYSQKGSMPQFNPQPFQTGASHPTSQLGHKLVTQHNAPSLIAGNPAAIADFNRYLREHPGRGFGDWMNAPTHESKAHLWV